MICSPYLSFNRPLPENEKGLGGGKKRDHPPLYDIVPRGDPGEYFVPGMVVGRNVFFF